MKRKKIYLISHRNPDGDLVFKDRIFGHFYDRICGEGHSEEVFYSSSTTRPEWIRYCKKPGVAMYAVMDDAANLVALVWLDSFRDKTARVNYCSFKCGLRDIVSIGKEVIQELLHRKDEAGNYMLDTMIGYTPKRNKIGIKFALKCGAEVVGTWENGVWIEKEKRSAPCLVTSYARDDESI